eukprot:gene16526-11822_t
MMVLNESFRDGSRQLLLRVHKPQFVTNFVVGRADALGVVTDAERGAAAHWPVSFETGQWAPSIPRSP